jgi:hypothetical protein
MPKEKAKMKLDFHDDAIQFSRENNCQPAAVVEKAMEHGAKAALIATTVEIKALTKALQEKYRKNLIGK